MLLKHAQDHLGDSFTIDPKAPPIEMGPEASKRLLESKRRFALESHWDDPMMDDLENSVRTAKRLRPHLPDSAFPDVGKDIIANHPSYRGFTDTPGVGVLTKTEHGASGWKNVQNIIKHDAELAYAAATKERMEQAAHKAMLGAAGLVGALTVGPRIVEKVAPKIKSTLGGLKDKLKGMAQKVFPKMIPKMADATLLYPALLATSLGVNAIKTLKDNRARQILSTALARESALKSQATKRIVGAAVGAGAVGAGAGYVAAKSQEKKAALDPVTLGLGGLAAAASTALALKQIKDQRVLTEAVNRANLTRRLLMASVAASTAGGIGAGYALGKKQPKATEKTILMQPVMMQMDPVTETKAAAEDDFAEHRNALRKMVNPIVQKLPGIKKVETAAGSDIVTSSIINDDSASGASK